MSQLLRKLVQGMGVLLLLFGGAVLLCTLVARTQVDQKAERSMEEEMWRRRSREWPDESAGRENYK